MSVLYVVSTPIGNLEDITLRALRVLREVALIAAEDTRVTRRLLSHYDIHTPMTSYHENNKKVKLPELMATLERSDVALVSDAGTPVVNDPGYELVREAVEAGVRVVPIPGPSALTSALAVCGLDVGQFIYLGFLPRKRSERIGLLQSASAQERAIVAFETPHRLGDALKDVLDTLGDRPIAVCRELTKMHEEVFRGSVSEALGHFTEPRGEFTVVIERASEIASQDARSVARAHEMLTRLRAQGMKARESVSQVVEATGLPRRRVYRMWLCVENEYSGNSNEN